MGGGGALMSLPVGRQNDNRLEHRTLVPIQILSKLAEKSNLRKSLNNLHFSKNECRQPNFNIFTSSFLNILILIILSESEIKKLGHRRSYGVPSKKFKFFRILRGPNFKFLFVKIYVIPLK